MNQRKMNRDLLGIPGQPAGVGGDGKRYSKGTIIRLGRYMLQYKWLLALALLCTLGSNLFALIGPKLTG